LKAVRGASKRKNEDTGTERQSYIAGVKNYCDKNFVL